MKIKNGQVRLVADSAPGYTVAELAKAPDAFRSFGIPPEATITYIDLHQSYSPDRRAELTISWEMP